jgi:hypothetical protein
MARHGVARPGQAGQGKDFFTTVGYGPPEKYAMRKESQQHARKHNHGNRYR